MNQTAVRHVVRLFCLCAAVIGLRSPALAADSELVFGVFPYLSPRQMVAQFNPLRAYLARELGQSVTLRSAPDYKSFAERTRQSEYDIAFDAPQLARLAQKRDGYLPLAQTGYKIVILALARKDSPVKTLADLRGRAISIGARMSITHQVMRRELLKVGLELDRDVTYRDTAYFSNVLQSVIRGAADAGATGTLLWESAPAAERAQLREIYRQPDPVPGFIMMAHPRLGEATRQRLRQALFRFKDTPEGLEFFRNTRQIDFRPVDEATMRSLDPYTEELQ
jgi:phosphonate transport system substrate-binding protein